MTVSATPPNMAIWETGSIIMLAVSLLFPLTGLVLLSVLAVDFLVIRNLKPMKRALS